MEFRTVLTGPTPGPEMERTSKLTILYPWAQRAQHSLSHLLQKHILEITPVEVNITPSQLPQVIVTPFPSKSMVSSMMYYHTICVYQNFIHTLVGLDGIVKRHCPFFTFPFDKQTSLSPQ